MIREDIYNFVNNPCWKEIRAILIEDKNTRYTLATEEDAKISTVKSCMDKISMIDFVLDLENEYIKQYNNQQGVK